VRTAPFILASVRSAAADDLPAIRHIYNEGIRDRATLDTETTTEADMATWWSAHDGRYTILVAEDKNGNIIGWASLNPYSHRCADSGVAGLSVYVARSERGTGVGSTLLGELEKRAKKHDFHKIVLFTFTSNSSGQGFYRKLGYREVGVFREQGTLDGQYMDVMAMEKLLRPSVLFVCRHNTGRSQMAEAYLRYRLGDKVDVASAGTIPADQPNAGVVAAMAEVGMDISDARPKLLDPALLARADHIITMGCDVRKANRLSVSARSATWSLKRLPTFSRHCLRADSVAGGLMPSYKRKSIPITPKGRLMAKVLPTTARCT
jgi:phosphinothricin acetyltransferase